jgi:hypothetical protein
MLRDIAPPRRRTSHFGAAREASVAARFSRPGTRIVSPRRQASYPSAATDAAVPTNGAGSRPIPSWLRAAPLSIRVAVTPGQSAVAVTPEPRSSSASDSVIDSTKALVAA